MAARQSAQRSTSLISRTQPLRTAQFRTMATTARKYEFLTIIPDKPGAREKRLEVRQQHFDALGPRINAGGLKVGGPLLNSIPEDDNGSKMDFFGSAFVVLAESKEEVLSKLKEDIYATAGVWDIEKAQIYPFKRVFSRDVE